MPLPKPEQMNYALDAAQVSQLKYQALLHHLNDAVIELDLDTGLYHVVHNPGPNFIQVLDNSQAEFKGLLLAGLHPENAAATEEKQM